MSRRLAVIAYDIESHRTRRRVHRILQEWRLDGQRSVHECCLSEAEATELFVQLAEVIDQESDRLLLAWLAMHRPAMARGRGRIEALSRELLRIG